LTAAINNKTEEAMAIKASSIGQKLKLFKNVPRPPKSDKKAKK